MGAFAAYGYVKDKENPHKLVIDQESAKIVKKIFEWKVQEGLGNLTICHRLNEMGILNPTGYKKKMLNQNYQNAKRKSNDDSWCPSTVRNILKNDIYIGNITQGKRRVKSYKLHQIEQVPKEEWIIANNMHEPIIAKEVFEKAQMMQKVDTRVQENGVLSMWAGILKCADCGRAMHKKSYQTRSGKNYEYYVCGTYRKKSHQLCTSHTIREDVLEQAVLQEIQKHIRTLLDFPKLFHQLESLQTSGQEDENIEKIKQAKKQEMEKIVRFQKSLYEDWKNGDISKEEYTSYKKNYQEEKDKMEQVIRTLEEEQTKKKQQKKQEETWMEEFRKNRNITKLDRTILQELIEKIEVLENGKIMIYFCFSNEG